MSRDWVSDVDVPLLADLYAFTMLEAYLREGLDRLAVFSVFARKLAPSRNFMVAAGLEQVLTALENFHFENDALKYLRTLGLSDGSLAYLSRVRFTGDVFAVEEGTPLFAGEPMLELVAPLAEAQLVEAWVLNQLHVQSLAASKAARVVHAAAGRTVVDFGLRRTQGADAALKVARGAFIGGVAATSNVLAGERFGIPVTGTMAHSYVQAHAQQLDAFRAFVRAWPETVLLVDTYDTLEGVRDVIRLAQELGPEFRVRSIRLDSGDLLELSKASRAALDAAGLSRVGIFASGGLDEHQVADLVRAGAPIGGFGVGTALGVSDDAPSLDLVYKLVSYGGTDRVKLSAGKPLLPGRKQIFRIDGERDVLAGADESHPGRPLLRQMMRAGKRIDGGARSVVELQSSCASQLARLPGRLRELERTEPFPVEVSPSLRARFEALRIAHARDGA